MKLSAVARARKREDMTSRLKRYIEQAQAQLEVVMREQEKAKVAAEKKDSVEEDGQENFNGLILD
jgi:ribosome recycling factor